MLFGCPLWQVGELVPAHEIPIWRAHFNAEPWGFHAQDMLTSKAAFQIVQSQQSMVAGSSYSDFMFKDRFESCELTQAEFDELSEDEQVMYAEQQVKLAMKVLA